MDINKLLLDVEVQQKEMHKFIDEYSDLLKEKMPERFKNMQYQDMVNVYFIFKIIELQHIIDNPWRWVKNE